jgi:hypothetical protein
MRTKAQAGRLTFVTTYRTVATDRKFRAFVKAIFEARPELAVDLEGALNDKASVSLFLLMLSITLDIVFDVPEDQMTEQERGLWQFWNWYTSTIVTEDARFLRTADETLFVEMLARSEESLANRLQSDWYKAYRQSDGPTPAAKEIAHPDTLTPEEKADPN